MVRRFPAPGPLPLAACAQDPSVNGNSIRICDDTGCSDRPKDQVSYLKRGDREDLRMRSAVQIAASERSATETNYGAALGGLGGGVGGGLAGFSTTQ